jgi:hypothetical protein
MGKCTGFLRDVFTGPDGDTWAIGRLYSLPVLLTGLSVPVASVIRNQPVDGTDLGILLAGTAGACLLLIRGSNRVDNSVTETLPTAPTQVPVLDQPRTPQL